MHALSAFEQVKLQEERARLWGQLQNCVNVLHRLKRHGHADDKLVADETIESANKALYETSKVIAETGDKNGNDIINIRQQDKDKIDELENKLVEQQAALDWFNGLMSESKGIAGYHLNGNIALWDEFEIPNTCAEELAKLISKAEQRIHTQYEQLVNESNIYIKGLEDGKAAGRELAACKQQIESMFHTIDLANEEIAEYEAELTACKDKLINLEDACKRIATESEEFNTAGDFPAYAVTPFALDKLQDALVATAETVAKHKAEIEANIFDKSAEICETVLRDGFVGSAYDCATVLHNVAAEKRGE